MKPFPHSKLQGEWAEACFAAEALRRGFIVSKPLGDSAPYDFVLDWRSSQRKPSRAQELAWRGRLGVSGAGPLRSMRGTKRSGTCGGEGLARGFSRNSKPETRNSLARIQVKSVSVRNP